MLLTNNTLNARAGSELYIRDVAIELMKRGHSPICYSQDLGEVADELRKATIPVIDDLSALAEKPDIIHGQHHIETMISALYFQDVPVIYFCHGWLPWQEDPPIHPSIMKYIAVDDLCYEKLITKLGMNKKGMIETLYNFVDLQRFKNIRCLPEKPKKALILSNYQQEVPQAIKRACKQHGIDSIEVKGLASGQPITAPENQLHEYDLVFAKARAALESMASGCSVIVMDYTNIFGLVTSDNVHFLRKLNFGVRTLQHNIINEAVISQELEKIDSKDAQAVTAVIRETADMQRSVDKLENIYYESIQSWKKINKTISKEELLCSASEYLKMISQRTKSSEHNHNVNQHLERQLKLVKYEYEQAVKKNITVDKSVIEHVSYKVNFY